MPQCPDLAYVVRFANMSDKSCGIQLSDASADKFQGEWKCHLAHTDLISDVDDVKAEAMVQVMVAVQVKELEVY